MVNDDISRVLPCHRQQTVAYIWLEFTELQTSAVTGSGVNGWKTLGDEVQAANRWTERMSGRPSPQHTES